MTPEERDRLVRAEEGVKGSASDIREIKEILTKQSAEIAKIQLTLSEAKGGWKMMMAMGGAGAAFGAIVGKFLPMLGKG